MNYNERQLISSEAKKLFWISNIAPILQFVLQEICSNGTHALLGLSFVKSLHFSLLDVSIDKIAKLFRKIRTQIVLDSYQIQKKMFVLIYNDITNLLELVLIMHIFAT